MSSSVAVVDRATVSLGGRRVLGPVSLRIDPGQHWALLGPNGSGKTTLLSLIGAERHPMSGTVDVLGERIGRTDVRVLRQHIGVVGHRVADRLPPQAVALDVVLTGRDGLLAPWWGDFDDADRIDAAAMLGQVHCAHLAAQAFGACSQGERQRILLARSLFGRHALLLLDEPALGVDLPGREALIGALDALAAAPDAPASVQVAHTLEELPTSISHALLVRDGLEVASGLVDDVLTDAALSSCFGQPFTVSSAGGRHSARAVAGR